MDNRVVFLRFLHPPQIFKGLITIVVLCCVGGCGKSENPPVPPAITPTTAPSDARSPRQHVLAVHWIGKNRLMQDTNAAYQTEIWRMPESVNLETQTLDKLARAMPRLLGVPSRGETNEWTTVVRPLLDDLVQVESFSELRTPTDRPPEFALALKLTADRAATWLTNVGLLKQLLSDPKADLEQPTKGIQFVLAGDWGILGIGGSEGGVFAEFVKRFSTTDRPEAMTNSHWMEVEADLSRLVRSNSAFSSENLPLVHLVLSGSGKDVRSRAELTFPKPLVTHLEPWNVPTNLVHDPLISFTALRGAKPLFASMDSLLGLKPRSVPDQLFGWAVRGSPFETYFAVDYQDSSNNFAAFCELVQRSLNPYLETNGWGVLKPTLEPPGVAWAETPFFAPYLNYLSASNGNRSFWFAGLYPQASARWPIPAELMAQLDSQTNLLYYDWEITEGRTVGWLHIMQTIRMIMGKPQLAPDSLGLKWLLGVSSKLGNSATALRLKDSFSLVFNRSSSVGLTGFEIHLLVDWLESPELPCGLHSTRAQSTVKPLRKRPNHPPSEPPINKDSQATTP